MHLHSSPSSTPTRAIRILIADRNRMGSQLLAESLARDPRFEIVAAAVAIAVRNNKLLISKRPAEFIRRSADSPPLRRVI